MSKRGREPGPAAGGSDEASAPAAKRAKLTAGGDRRWITGLAELEITYIIRPLRFKQHMSRLYTLRRVSKWYAICFKGYMRAEWPNGTPIPAKFPWFCKFLKYMIRYNWPIFPMVVDSYRLAPRGWWASLFPFNAADCIPTVEFHRYPAMGRHMERRCFVLSWATPLSNTPIRFEETRVIDHGRVVQVIFRAVVDHLRCDEGIDVPPTAKYDALSWVFAVCRDVIWWGALQPSASKMEHRRLCDLLYTTIVAVKDKIAKQLAAVAAAGTASTMMLL